MLGMSAYQTLRSAVLRFNDFLMAEYGEEELIAFGIRPRLSRTLTYKRHTRSTKRNKSVL